MFVNTYKRYKYKVCTMEQFKFLSKKYLFGCDGRPFHTAWDISMDGQMFKQDKNQDSDRKVLMPSD